MSCRADEQGDGWELTRELRDSIQHLRDLKGFFGTTFKIKALGPEFEDEPEGQDKVEQLVLSCVGTGFTNTAKRTCVALLLTHFRLTNTRWYDRG